MISVNDFHGLTDNEVFERAIAGRQPDGIVVVPPRASAIEPERTYWLLDRAVLLPENTTVVLQNCTIKLSDRCRDNFFRSANCGMGVEFPERIRNVHIRGEGLCTLLGADHPRATGDGSKIIANPCPYLAGDLCKPELAPWIPEERRSVDKLDFWDFHDHSYGTDAGKEGESQYGDWRGIGILLANVEDFSVSGLRMVKTHGWAISLEECANGRVEKIHFDMNMSKEIDGMLNNMENQDGIDVRNGCHHITISDITGSTGDDVVALTAIAGSVYRPGGSLRNTHVMHNDWTRRDRNIHDVIIRNVSAYSQLCWSIRLLPAESRIWNVIIDGVIDNPPEGVEHSGTLLLGCADGSYGRNHPDSMSNITISNVICDSRRAITVDGYLADSVISNVISRNPENPVVTVRRENGMKNVLMSNVITAAARKTASKDAPATPEY